MPDEQSTTAHLRAPTNAHRVAQVLSAIRPFDGGSRVACAFASVPRCLVTSAADSCPRAARADHATGQHAGRSRRRLSAGCLVSGKNGSVPGWLHGRRALVRRRLRPQTWLDLREVSLDTTQESAPHRNIFGRGVLERPLSVATVVCRQAALGRLGNAVLPAAAAKGTLSARCPAGALAGYLPLMIPRCVS